MAKKCIPGVICIENMTLFLLALLTISVGYLYYRQFAAEKGKETRQINSWMVPLTPDVNSPQNMYSPPLNIVDVRGPPIPPSLPTPPPQNVAVVGIPVNIRTSTANTAYRQIGILTKNVRSGNGTDPLILPLFGRNLLNGRDKWQYYTMANSGGMTFNAKLPISVNGRSCTSEYGCDSVSNGDTVFVEGYEDTFRATIYENSTLNYIPL
jgi:hypothetical protein